MSRLVQIVLTVFLVLLLVSLLPAWPYSGGWGYYPSGGAGLLLVILLIALLLDTRGRSRNSPL